MGAWRRAANPPQYGGAVARGLRSIGPVERSCLIGETETVERCFFVNAILADGRRFTHAVRGHWGVENRLH